MYFLEGFNDSVYQMYQENERIIDAQKILLLVLFCKPSFRSPLVGILRAASGLTHPAGD